MRIMLHLTLFFTLSSFFSACFAQSDSIGFSCTVLHPENAENSEVTASADSVKFRLFYVDDACSDFSYNFKLKSNILLVQRTSSDPQVCTSDEQILYGVEGILTNVPKGKYIFELQTGPDEKRQESIFREIVNIKK